MSKQIIISNIGAGFSVAIPTEAEEQKSKTLQLAAKIVSVANLNEQQSAIEVTSYLQGLAKGMEETREEVKKPFLEAGRQIDATARGYSAGVLLEAARIRALIGGFQESERKKAELLRLEQERLQREALEKAQQEITQSATASERQAAELDAMELEEAVQTPIVIHSAPKAEGASVSNAWDFEVQNIAQLYAAFPHLVKLEVDRAAVKYHLKTLALQGKPVTLPGIRAFQETKIAVRAKKL